MLEIKGMIRKLEAEKHSLEMKVIKINKIINDLKEMSNGNIKEQKKQKTIDKRVYPRKLIKKRKNLRKMKR